MKRDPVHAALQALAQAARRPQDAATAALVRDSLTHRSNHVAARAARLVREAALTALALDLITAFPRFLQDAVKRDPGCVAKTEIVRALLSLEYPAPDIYVGGAAHVQREPAFGEPVDTAPELRATSAMALVLTEHPAALGIAVGLLVDPEPAARAGGLRALVASGRPDIALLMRLFALRGDADPGVLAEAFVGLLALAADDAVSFVAERLASVDRDLARAAAMALGEARGSDGIRALGDRLSHERRPDVRHAIIVALATSRGDDAFTILLELIARGTSADSEAAMEAIGLFPHDETLDRRVQAALAARRASAAGANEAPSAIRRETRRSASPAPRAAPGPGGSARRTAR